MPRKPFLIRVDEQILAGIQKWADDDLRSLNGQIEWLLRQALVQRGRAKPSDDDASHRGDAADSDNEKRA